MSKCENCIHYDCCLFLKNKLCLHFKDKSLFVEVVRCKDCVHAKLLIYDTDGTPIYVCTDEEFPENRPDDFCSHGKRKLSEVGE